jgi:integrase
MCELGLVAQSTVDNQAFISGILIRHLGEHGLSDLRKSHVELYIGERLKTCSPITVKGELNVLRQVLNWCVDEQLMHTKPRLPTVSVPSVEQPLPSDEAFLWVLAHVPPQHARALEFMMLTGLSPHELEQLQDCDIHEQLTIPGRTLLRIGMRPDFRVKQPSRRREIPLNGRARTIWWEASAASSHGVLIFPSLPAMQKAIQRAVAGNSPRKLYEKATPAGAEHITPKMMRKWFASKVAGQQPEHVLQSLMGHAPGSPITRKHYVRSTAEQGATAVGQIEI